MQFIYPAVFKKKSDGSYRGYFPNLDKCEVSGDSLDDAIRNAIAAEYDWIMLELDEEDPQMPLVSDLADLQLKKGEIARNIGVHIRLYEGWDE